MRRYIILLLAIAGMAFTAEAENREQLAQIATSVDESGNFKYWKENSPTIRQLKRFVSEVTNPTGAKYVPEQDRIATFDLDGTMLCETDPCQLCITYALDLLGISPEGIDLSKAVEFVIKAINGLTIPDLKHSIADYINRAECPSYNDLKVGEAFYLPMLEVLSYLRSNGFDVWIVSGSPREFSRIIASDVTHIPYSHIIGTDIVLTGEEHIGESTHEYNLDKGEQTILCGLNNINIQAGKVQNIYNSIGRRPILAFGNSDGDFSMFRLATDRDDSYEGMAFCLLPDDDEREYANPETTDMLNNECSSNGWHTVSMKEEFKTIYGESHGKKTPTALTSVTTNGKASKAYGLDGKVIDPTTKGTVIIQDGVKRMR